MELANNDLPVSRYIGMARFMIFGMISLYKMQTLPTR